MLKRILLLAVLFNSQPLLAENLLDIYELALQNDAQLKIAESNYLSAAQALPLASSARLPQINLSVETSERETDSSLAGTTTTTTGDRNTGSNGYSLNLTQSIYNAETSALVDVAEAQVVRARAELEASRQDLIIRVTESYFNILAAQDNVEFAVAEKNAIGRQLEQAQKRFEVGLIAITDVLEAQARFDSAVAQQLLFENLLENAFQALRIIIAKAPSTDLARLDDKIELSLPDPANSELWVEMALQNNQNLMASLAALKAADFTRQRQSAGDYPTLDFNASYSDNSLDDDDLGKYDQDDLSLSIQLNLPLYTGGRINAEKQQAEADYQSARNASLLQKRLTAQQTRDAYLGVVSGISQVKALRQALSSSTTALKATEAGFEVGTRTSVDVLVSLRETYAARRDYASARYDYLTNLLRLKQGAGLLYIEDLTQINRWLKQ